MHLCLHIQQSEQTQEGHLPQRSHVIYGQFFDTNYHYFLRLWVTKWK